MSHYIIPTDKCVFVTCESDMPLAEMAVVWRDVQRQLNELKWSRVLVDVTALQTIPKTEELFDLAKFIWLDFPRFGRLALVVRWDQARAAGFLEALVRTVGLYLKIFVNEETAEAWVLDGEHDKQSVQASAQ